MARHVLLIVLVALILVGVDGKLFAKLSRPEPIFDHQTTTYSPNMATLDVPPKDQLTVTPFFSPDHSVETITEIIENAESTVTIGTPSFSSWGACGMWEEPMGCTVDVCRNNETFPVFTAMLNAIHRGVKVRMLTNLFDGEEPSEGLIGPVEFLSLAGVEVRYFTTVTFLHTKYMQRDGKKALVSSVNFSHTSIMKNREAGLAIEGPGAQPYLDWIHQIFEEDWAQAKPWPIKQHYSDKDMGIIKNTAKLPVVIPPPVHFPDAYVTQLSPVTASMRGQIMASPDTSLQALMAALNMTKHSFGLFMYQITSDEICDKIIAMTKAGLDMKLLVSHNIYDDYDWSQAKICYKKMTDAGVKLQKTRNHMYSYSHCKFYIRDGELVQMSTGNFSPTDYPGPGLGPGGSFPPWGADWTRANRDYSMSFEHPDLIAQFQKVLDKDYDLGEPW